ncbi:hypothetical protein BN440_3811 [Erwinia amylovora MR1]|nr:hypothetical protein BN440_3811 [Erwinia amylovora MR1]
MISLVFIFSHFQRGYAAIVLRWMRGCKFAVRIYATTLLFVCHEK